MIKSFYANLLIRESKDAHTDLMREQKRASKSKAKGKKNIDQSRWPAIIGKTKASMAERTSGKKKSAINKKHQQLATQLSDLRLPEILLPKFSLNPDNIVTGNILYNPKITNIG